MKRTVILTDVARAAGVSVATASNALTGRRSVSDRAKRDVLDAAKRLGYRVNDVARSLRTGRVSSIGVIAPDVTNPFFSEMIQLIEVKASERGWSVVISDSGFDASREDASLDRLVASAAGVVLFSTNPGSSRIVELPEGHVPVVACDEPIGGGVASVRSDNHGGARSAARHMVDAGGRVFGVIGGPAHLPTSDERREGFIAGLRDAGLDAAAVVHHPYDMDGGRSGMHEVLVQRPDVDAVFACTDMQAIGGLFEAQQLGRRVPQDLLLCGFDGIAWGSRMVPSITTVQQDLEGMVDGVISLLEEMLAGAPPRNVVLPVEVVERDSTAPLAHR